MGILLKSYPLFTSLIRIHRLILFYKAIKLLTKREFFLQDMVINRNNKAVHIW